MAKLTLQSRSELQGGVWIWTAQLGDKANTAVQIWTACSIDPDSLVRGKQHVYKEYLLLLTIIELPTTTNLTTKATTTIE